MLTQKEEEGIKAILRMMTIDDLLSLTFTTTKGFVKPENQHEAIQAVLLYCEKPSLLLRRRKIKRELLFHYLKDMGIQMSVNGEKREYIAACLKFWQGNESSMDNSVLEDLEEIESLPSQLVNVASQYVVFPNEPTNNQRIPVSNQFQEYNLAVTSYPETEQLLMLGKFFVEWFYKTLNGNNAELPQHTFDQTNFWPDCSLNWNVEGNDLSSKSTTVIGPHKILQFFNQAISNNKLLMVPASESVQTVYNSHGVVKVNVNGVLHQLPIAAGLFEQTFFLIKDPFSSSAGETWRIKNSILNMRLNCPLMSYLQSQDLRFII